ncbi:hypothetical protein WJX72_000285 [[Myrmecia] bisecta]|uniref:AT1G65230-like protein n=1 Tax=[Myrmecia] bisecta TaxID=41462 RepID=A0AAW1QNK9_9CHLO
MSGHSKAPVFEGFRRPASAQRTEHGRPVLTSATAETQTHVEEEEQEIEGLSRDYCTEFVCTSSPAVEQTVRALARDLTRLNTWTTSLFQKDVEYKDPLRSFRGVEKYKRLNYPYDNIKDPKVLVTKMQMVDMGVARISWRLRGSLAALPLDIDFVSEFELNLVTGRVRSHRERWDVSRMSFPARLAYNLSRIAWSAKQASLDTKEGGDKLLASLSLDEDDGDKDVLYRNPTDPTKFFQQDDNTMKDALALATIIAFLYLMVNAWTELAKL